MVDQAAEYRRTIDVVSSAIPDEDSLKIHDDANGRNGRWR